MMAAGFPAFLVLLISLSTLAFAAAEPANSDLLKPVPFEKPISLLKDGKTEEAFELLLSEKKTYTGTEWEGRMNFFSGTVASRLERYRECINFLNGDKQIRLLADYIDLTLAACYAGVNEYEKAILALQGFNEKHPFSARAGQALFDRANYLNLSGRVDEGLAEVNRFLKLFPKHLKIPDAYMLKARALESLKKPVEAYEPYRTLYYHFPENPLAAVALERTILIRRDQRLKIPVTPIYPRKIRVRRLIRKRMYKEAIKDIRRLMKLVKGAKEIGKLHISLAQVLRGSGQKTKAAGTLIEFLTKYPESRTSARARYLLGKLFWNQGMSDKALKQMDKIVKSFPKSAWSARALYVAGRIYEERGDRKNASMMYQRVVQAYSKSSIRDNAVWRMGWLYFSSQKYKKMISFFQHEMESAPPDFSGKDKLMYWVARAYEKKGDVASAQSHYEQIATFPFSYYGAIAHSRLAHLNGRVLKKTENAGRETSASTSGKGLGDSVKSALEIAGEPHKMHILKGLEFVRLGLLKNANVEFSAAEPGLKGSLNKNMLAGDLYEVANEFNKAYRIRDQVLSLLSKRAVENLPRDYWASFFPLSYRESVINFAKKKKVDPLLVLSVIKQESAYDPAAHSSAGARGLMQILPRTGKRLYRTIFKKGDFHQNILFDPKVNLKLGIHYLSRLLARNKGDTVLAVATYNAGPRPVKRWSAKYGGVSRDEFIEKIPYPETRRYVKKVLKNYENYKVLYPEYSMN